MLTVYGLKNCDTCRKATKWLDAQGIAHEFRDLRAMPPTSGQWSSWLAELGQEALVNRRGTTWRGLPETEREGLDEAGAAALLAAHPALMKRPLFDLGDRRLLGFAKAQQDELTALAGT
tara:strand:+ start:1817 stop:2173 length:357 start_codon:yes stop_codon:yes gene_type:complete